MIKTIITDFDGTLVDTFQANLMAYQKAFSEFGLTLTEQRYRECFGLRYDNFMEVMAISDAYIIDSIRERKTDYYPQFFPFIKLNKSLAELIRGFKSMGGKTAIASTARKENLMNVVDHFGINDCFDCILAGIDVKEGKPSPEVYLESMRILDSIPEDTLIFEDSDVGVQAAKASGANVIIVPSTQFA